MYTWTNGDTAIFSGTSGTVSLASTSISAGAIQFTTSGYTVSSNTLTIPSGGTTIAVGSGLSATITSAISGGVVTLGGVTGGCSGGGNLTLSSSANSYQGMTINYGTLTAGAANTLPNGTVFDFGSSSGGSGAAPNWCSMPPRPSADSPADSWRLAVPAD